LNSSQPNESLSLKRTLEPESMDSGTEVDEYARMNHDAVNQAFVDDLTTSGSVGMRVVDFGCGNAAIPVLLCQRLSDVEILGIDSSKEMLEAARIEIELGGATGRIFLEHASVRELDGFGSEIADTVISNSLVHHLPEPQLSLVEAARLTRDGGRVFFRDLLRPETAAEVERLVELHAGDESDFAQQLLRQSLHAALTLEEICDLAESAGMSRDCVQTTSDRHWTLDWTKA
jgi:ubiquinone/menaquinone biosynthesis C-methylase UbiE